MANRTMRLLHQQHRPEHPVQTDEEPMFLQRRGPTRFTQRKVGSVVLKIRYGEQSSMRQSYFHLKNQDSTNGLRVLPKQGLSIAQQPALFDGPKMHQVELILPQVVLVHRCVLSR